MLQIKYYETVPDEALRFAVIAARAGSKWVFCKHRERDTWEMPGGRREPGEIIDDTARRELYEETGALEFIIKPLTVYSVQPAGGEETFGMLYTAEIKTFEPELHNEIEQILITDKLPEQWTYPQIQPGLLAYAGQYLGVSAAGLHHVEENK